MVYTGTTSLYEGAKEMFLNTNEQTKVMDKKLPEGVKDVYLGKKSSTRNHEKLKMDSEFLMWDNFEPKRNNRAILTFVKSKIPKWVVKSFTRPSYPFELNNTIEIVLLDPIEPSTTESIIDLLKETNGLNKKKLKLRIEMLDPVGLVVEKWVLKDCVITEVNWSPINYSDNSISTLTLKVKYNKIKLK